MGVSKLPDPPNCPWSSGQEAAWQYQPYVLLAYLSQLG